MMNPIVSNPNDFKVVDFTNKTNFDFTPEMGCMFDSHPIFGISGAKGIKAGESIKLPYHIGHRLATNLAKAVMTRRAPTLDPAGIPTGVPLWSEAALTELKSSFITDLYSEARPIAETEVDRLMKKVNELNTLVQSVLPKEAVSEAVKPAEAQASVSTDASAYQDKAEVIAELTKRNVAHDPRQTKAELEKLLA